MKTIDFEFNKTLRTLYHFEASSPKGIVIFLHGAGEYALKYERFAQDLNKEGFSVILFDQLGHGQDAKTNGFVHFNDHEGHKILLKYLHEIVQYVSLMHKDLPLYLVAHSMGTFIARAYLNTEKSHFKAHIFIGSSNVSHKDIFLAQKLGKLIKSLKGAKHISPFFTHLMQDKPYKSMKKRGLIEHRYEWVSSDEVMQEKYKDDPLMHHPFTISAQLDITKLMALAQSNGHLNTHPTHTLTYFLCGDQDALCDYGKDTKALYNHYSNLGYTNLGYKVIENARHEILHDVTYKKVTDFIIDSLKKA